MAKHPAVEALAKAVKGLKFPSESEAPLELFLWPGAAPLNATRVLELSGVDEMLPFDDG